MSTAVLAARKCAKTILWQSLRLSAFQGAIPHVLLVVDRTPCVLQKVLLEGYLQELDSINSASSDREKGPLRVGLDPSACMPSYSDGLDKAWKVTYSALPFSADTFLDDVRALQAFLRQCGGKSADMEDGEKEERWSEEKMKSVFESLAPILSPYIFPDVDTVKNPIDGAEWKEDLLRELRVGPPRELLGCILIERNAFQNELEKYRLRLDLFNMGLRVAEHNHLECMSRKADALTSKESNGNREDCLEDDEVIYYMQSCSLQPHVAELIGRAIADSIDALSWSRRTVGGGSGTGSADQEDENAPADVVVPPASFHEALSNTDIWSVYNTGVLRWEGTSNDIDTKKNDSNGEDVSSKTSSKIIGPGTPLRIICRDGQILTFEGGLEDCLLNTGYYAASHTEERNFVYSHRQRFPVHYDDAAKRKKEMTEVEEDASISGTSVKERRGRLKKKEYLAMLKLQGKKNTTGGTFSCSPSDGGINDNDEDDVRRSNEVAGASVGSSIGGTFPVGEVITESFDLSKLNGSCTVFAYPSLFKEVTMAKPQPVTMRIENGIVTDIGPDAPEDLLELISLVRQVEGSCYVRELGIGLSPHVGRERILSDVTAFERQFGVHVSLGQRHPLFVKQASKRNADGSPAVQVDGPVLKRKAGKYHIDVFLDAVRLEMGSFTLDFTKGCVSSSGPCL